MKEFKEIIVSKSESVYETIERLKKEGELEEAWLLVSKEAERRMMDEDEISVGESRYVSAKFMLVIKLGNTLYSTKKSDLVPILASDNPKKIFCLDVE